MRLKSLSFGVLPKFSEFKKHVLAWRDDDGNKVIPFDFVLASDGQPIIDAINVGIDSHLEAIKFTQRRLSGGMDGGKLKIVIEDVKSLYILIRRLNEAADEGDEESATWASDIMNIIGYEWI